MLGGAGDKVGYILVTVDPERDTPEKLGEYVTFDPFPTGLRGFTGTVEQIEAAKTAYIVYAQKVALEDSAADYTIDHADLIFLMGDDGKFVDFFTGRDTPQDIAMGVRQLLKKG